MRKLVVLTFVSLDGVMQAPGGKDEDPSEGFAYGGWTHPYFDEFMGGVMAEQMSMPFDLLLGRKTYELFASFWPNQNETENPGAGPLNKAKKYVASKSSRSLDWENSVLLNGDVSEKIRDLKEQDGPVLQVHGSSSLIQTLLKDDLIDEMWLKIFPVTLGIGKRLFGGGVAPTTYELVESKTSPKGVIVAKYARKNRVIDVGTF
jgi:dihydrofolate reductase